MFLTGRSETWNSGCQRARGTLTKEHGRKFDVSIERALQERDRRNANYLAHRYVVALRVQAAVRLLHEDYPDQAPKGRWDESEVEEAGKESAKASAQLHALVAVSTPGDDTLDFCLAAAHEVAGSRRWTDARLDNEIREATTGLETALKEKLLVESYAEELALLRTIKAWRNQADWQQEEAK